ncbi:MAG: hypothetical protein IR153_03855 [Flavobacterium sp.]|nr:hypothetical protein [Flavobacterium sp.]
MRDNKPIELEAENYVCSRLAKMNLRYSKPNFDLDGGDIIVINQIDKDSYKSINIQVKGRDITSNNSNVKIHKSYVADNFVFFLYLRINEDLNDYLYCFFDKDISNWEIKGDNYYLNIPQKSIEENTFETFLFSKDKISKISDILSKQKEKHFAENTQWNLTLLENNITLWQTTKCLPDHNLTSWFLENTNPNYSLVSHNIFLTCLAIIHSDKLQTISAVDYMFIHFKNCDIKTDATISDIKVVETFSSNWFITYPKSKVDLLLLKYNGVTLNALRLVFGDNEEQVEGILIDNGDLTLTYNEK